jgi:hypothetical protein
MLLRCTLTTLTGAAGAAAGGGGEEQPNRKQAMIVALATRARDAGFTGLHMPAGFELIDVIA